MNSDLNPKALNGMFRQNIRRKFGDATDGTSNTILLSERKIYDPVFDSSPIADDAPLIDSFGPMVTPCWARE
jgi:hypothetical protein